MSTSITFNSTSYTVPAVGDANWGSNVSSYLIAIASGCLQKSGGAFTLTADANFGSSFGLVAKYVKSVTANIASAGVVRLAKTDSMAWRNNANNADLALGIDSGDLLTFNSIPIVSLALGAAYTVLQMNAGGTAYTWATPTGTGAPVLATSPTLVTPVLGVATATSINKMAITAPASSSTLAVADGKTATISNTLTFAGTDGNTMTFPSGSSTVMTLASVDSISGAKTFASTKLIATNVVVSGSTLTFPAAVDTLVGKATTDTLTNKSITSLLALTDLQMRAAAPLKFYNAGNSNFVALQAGTLAGDTTWTLPTADGSANQVLSTNGSAVLSWVSVASASLNQYNVSVGNASNVVTSTNTNLLGDITAQTRSQTATVTIATPGVFTSNSHGMALGDSFYLTTSGALPTGLTASTRYYASNIATNTFNASTTLANAIAGTYVNTTGTQSGTHTLFMGGFAAVTGSKVVPETTTGDVSYLNSSGFKQRLGVGAANTVLQSTGTLPAWGPVVDSGNYAPTFVTNNAAVVTSVNITLLGSNNFRWMRIGSVVSVVGAINCNASSGGVADFTATLPVSSNFTLSSDASGAATVEAGDGTTVRSPAGYIMANASATTVRFVGTIGNAGTEIFRFTFMYNIK